MTRCDHWTRLKRRVVVVAGGSISLYVGLGEVAIFARRTQETFPGMVEGLSAISAVQNPCRLVGCAESQEWSMV
jgi:hypothetical protein